MIDSRMAATSGSADAPDYSAILAAPRLAPLVIDLAGGTKVWWQIGADQDAIFINSSGSVYNRLQTDGGHDITILGVSLTPNTTYSLAAIYLVNPTGSVTVQGVHIDNGPGGPRDGIDIYGAAGYRPNLSIVDTMVENITGSYSGFHGDLVQSIGSLGDLSITNFVGSTNYQGIFLGGTTAMAPTSFEMTNAYIGYAPGQNAYPLMMWLGGGDGHPVFDTKFENVMFDAQVANRTTNYASVVYDGDDLVAPTRVGNEVSWNSPTMSGGVTLGYSEHTAMLPTNDTSGANYAWQAALAAKLGVDDVRFGTDAVDTIVAGAGGHAIFAGLGNDFVTGGDQADYIVGGYGADRMTGGAGNDVYVVDNAWDSTIETAGGGTDTVLSGIGWTLASEVENLSLTGTLAINGTGNALDNVIAGNLAANTLTGADGNDWLYGAEGVDILDGGAGDDTLNGGVGADIMTGGAGNDTYAVDAGDVVVESTAGSAGGIDTVLSQTDYVLGANLENLVLLGNVANSAIGNGLANIIHGNDNANLLQGLLGDDQLFGGAGGDTLNGDDGNDWLDGGTGADIMAGGTGDDTYVVDDIGDQIVEAAGGVLGGHDTVRASISYTLAPRLDDLVLTGTADLNGLGNRGDNVLTGNSGANMLDGGGGRDRLDGGGGADTLTGGNGRDVFVFHAGEADGDRVTDFAQGESIELSGYSSRAWASLAPGALVVHDGTRTETIAISIGTLAQVSFTDVATGNAPDHVQAMAHQIGHLLAF